MIMSEIDARVNRGINKIFSVKGLANRPESIDFSAIHPTIDYMQNGWSNLDDQTAVGGAESITPMAGIQTYTVPIVDYVNNSGSYQPRIIVEVGYNLCVAGFSYQLYFDAAGAAAFNNKYIASALHLVSFDTVQSIKKYRAMHQMASTKRMVFDGDNTSEKFCCSKHMPYVPAGMSVTFTIWSEDGTNFPANTSLICNTMGLAFPFGTYVGNL